MARRVYYVLFENYQQGLALRQILLEEGVENRIAPAPYALLGEVSCGMALLIEAADIDRAKAVMDQRQAVYHAVVPLDNQLDGKRDRYC